MKKLRTATGFISDLLLVLCGSGGVVFSIITAFNFHHTLAVYVCWVAIGVVFTVVIGRGIGKKTSLFITLGISAALYAVFFIRISKGTVLYVTIIAGYFSLQQQYAPFPVDMTNTNR